VFSNVANFPITTRFQKQPAEKFHVGRGAEPVEWAHEEPEEYKNAPHSFVLHRARLGNTSRELS